METNTVRYCREYYDNESGLTYLRNRYYNSQIGRFISEDPIRDGANWYVYGNNNPIAFVDPMGLVGVLLRYAINDLGGTVEYSDGIATVTYNGKTHSYNQYELEVINGRIIIDTTVLANDFGVDEWYFMHHDNDGSQTISRFESADDAALAFSVMYYYYSVSGNCEYGSVILEGTNNEGGTYYTFYDSQKGSENSVSISSVYYLPPNMKIVAGAHTHGSDDADYINEQFSGAIQNPVTGQWEGDALSASNLEKGLYLFTPNRKFKRLDKEYASHGFDLSHSTATLLFSLPVPNDSPYVTEYN